MDIRHTQEIEDRLADLLWEFLSKSKGHIDRRETSWGSKTKMGLTACILNIVTEGNGQDYRGL